MNKQLNEGAMQDELAHSAFFRPAEVTQTAALSPTAGGLVANATIPQEIRERPDEPHPSTPTGRQPGAQPPVLPSGFPLIRPSARPHARRTTTRYSFEFYQDQIETLKRLSLDEKLLGEPGSMSEMVREALDSYLARQLAPAPTDPEQR